MYLLLNHSKTIVRYYLSKWKFSYKRLFLPSGDTVWGRCVRIRSPLLLPLVLHDGVALQRFNAVSTLNKVVVILLANLLYIVDPHTWCAEGKVHLMVSTRAPLPWEPVLPHPWVRGLYHWHVTSQLCPLLTVKPGGLGCCHSPS